jgi:putative transposase
MCKVLEVSKSGFSDWLNRPICKTKAENLVLAEYIQTFFLLSQMRYGSPRIKADLEGIGKVVGENRVARIMAENGFRARFKKKYIITTDSNHSFRISPNLLNRNFVASAPNQKWISDITYLWSGDKWIYLCVIIDLYSRKVVGWSISKNIDTELLIDAFLMAVTLRNPPKGLIFHSDRGVQYASDNFRKLISLYGMKQSMSRK